MTFLSPKSILMLSAAAVLIAPAAAHALTDAEKGEIGPVIREYILENPGLILEAVEKHRANEEAKTVSEAKTYLSENQEIIAGADLPSIGSDDADVTIVEFMDYNCGYCKRALPDISKLIESDKKIKFVFHEMPVLGPTSRTASQWALAAHKQGKYFDYHAALMNHRGQKTEAELVKLAEKLELDVEQMKKDAGSKEVQEMLNSSSNIARNLGLQGTPAFIVGDQVFRGYIGHDGLEKAIEQARK